MLLGIEPGASEPRCVEPAVPCPLRLVTLPTADRLTPAAPPALSLALVPEGGGLDGTLGHLHGGPHRRRETDAGPGPWEE